MANPWEKMEEAYDYTKDRIQPPKDVQDKIRMPSDMDKVAKTILPHIYYPNEAMRRAQGGEGVNAPGNIIREKVYGGPKGSKGGDPLGKIKGDIYPDKPTIGAGGFAGGYGSGGSASTSPYGQLKTKQESLADLLKRRAWGETPSIAATAAQQAQDKNVAQSMALAMSQPNSPLGRRAVMQNQAMAGQNIARDLANARLAEMHQSQQEYSGLLGSMSSLQSQRDVAEMQDRRARELAQAELQYKQDLVRSGLNRQMYGAAFDVLGAGLETFAEWYKRNPGGTEAEYLNEVNASNEIPSEYPASFSDSIDNYPPEGESGIYDLPSTAPNQPETVFPSSGESMALTGYPNPNNKYVNYSDYNPIYDYRRLRR